MRGCSLRSFDFVLGGLGGKSGRSLGWVVGSCRGPISEVRAVSGPTVACGWIVGLLRNLRFSQSG